MAATTTIRLPPKLRARIRALARHSGRSAHSVIVEAVERHVEHEEALRALIEAARTSDEEIARLGEVYGADEVGAWLERLGRGEPAPRPPAWRR